jgi:hypothetical protein
MALCEYNAGRTSSKYTIVLVNRTKLKSSSSSQPHSAPLVGPGSAGAVCWQGWYVGLPWGATVEASAPVINRTGSEELIDAAGHGK